MDPKLTEQLQETLAALLANAQDAAAWTKGQLPALVQEKILFGRINETVQWLLCLVAFYVTARFCLKAFARFGRDDEPGWLIGGVFAGAGAIVFMFTTAWQTQQMLMAWFAPRLYIVEWLMEQVRK